MCASRRSNRHLGRTGSNGPGGTTGIGAFGMIPLRQVEKKRLRQIWDRVPKVDCQGLCHGACGVILMSALEHRLIENHVGKIPQRDMQDGLSCPLLNEETKRCKVYDVRPLVCRLYGAVEGMECKHGCLVHGPLLTKQQGWELMAEAFKLSGSPVLKCSHQFTPLEEQKGR